MVFGRLRNAQGPAVAVRERTAVGLDHQGSGAQVVVFALALQGQGISAGIVDRDGALTEQLLTDLAEFGMVDVAAVGFAFDHKRVQSEGYVKRIQTNDNLIDIAGVHQIGDQFPPSFGSSFSEPWFREQEVNSIRLEANSRKNFFIERKG